MAKFKAAQPIEVDSKGVYESNKHIIFNQKFIRERKTDGCNCNGWKYVATGDGARGDLNLNAPQPPRPHIGEILIASAATTSL